MATHTFEGITPPARGDGIPWTLIRVEESPPDADTFTERAVLSIPIDPTPSTPEPLDLLTVTTATLDTADFRFRFDVSPSNPSPYTDTVRSPAVAGATYTTPSAVRKELGITASVLSDTAAAKLIADAEDVIDSMLGAWYPDETTGRKIVRGVVLEWQWAKLDRATAKLAAAVYGSPNLISGREYNRIKGPDFEREGPRGAAIGAQIITLLDDSGLRRLTGRVMSCRRSMRPDYARFLSATRHDGT
jgi:hypothetical protein